MAKRLVKRLGVLLSIQATVFGVISGYDRLTGGTLFAWLTWLVSRGWSVHIVVALYWIVPAALYITGETSKAVAVKSLRYLRGRYLRWKLEKVVHPEVTAGEVLAAITQSRRSGLVSADEARVLEQTIRDLDPIEFEILVLFDDPIAWAKRHKIEYPQWKIANRSQLVEFVFPPLKGQQEHYTHSVNRLQAKRLLLLSPDALSIALPRGELFSPITTVLGHKLAHLIRKCKEEMQ